MNGYQLTSEPPMQDKLHITRACRTGFRTMIWLLFKIRDDFAMGVM